MFIRFSTRFRRFSIRFSTRFSIRWFSIGFSTRFSIRGVSTGVSGVPAGVKPAMDLGYNSLLNPNPLDSNRAGLIPRRYSNRRRAALKVAFVWIQASGKRAPGSSGVLSNLAWV
jgi:hypothetical protein